MPFNKWEAENFRCFLLMMPNKNCGLHLHLRLQGVSDPPLQLLVFSTPELEVRVGIRNVALSFGKNWWNRPSDS